jgi:ATP-binding cassette subfamily F protein uup
MTEGMDNPMNLISVHDISKTYVDKVLFDHLSFGIDEGDRIGLIGLNGTGKSTLLKVIAELLPPDQGQVIRNHQAQVEYLPQIPEFNDAHSVLDHVFEGSAPIMKLIREYEQLILEISETPSNKRLQQRLSDLNVKMEAMQAWELDIQAKTILTKLGITDFTASIRHLSGGQRKRVAMARALIQPSDLLILDEPTNHIDNETIIWLESYLSKRKGALLLITHDRYFLDRVVNQIFELDRGRLFTYKGNYESYLEAKVAREENESTLQARKANLLRKEMAWLRRGAKARTTKQKARIDRIELLRNEKSESAAEPMDMALKSQRLGKKVIELQNVSKRVADQILFHKLSNIISPTDRVGIVGPNGSGKSTLLNIIAHHLQPDEGTVEIGETVRIGYYTQESIGMKEDMRVIDYIKEAAERVETIDGQVLSASQMLERFLFPPDVQWKPIAKLSGGERRRLYLLRILMGEPNVLLLDEPTNDLDIQTLTVLEDYLDHFPGAVITVSHDRYFLDRSMDRLLAFEAKGQIRGWIGSYTEYQETRVQEALEQNTESPVTQKFIKDTTAASIDSNKPRKLSYNEQRELEGMEDRIAEFEEQLQNITQQIGQAGSDYLQLQEWMAEQADVEAELNRTIDRWAELTELAEQFAETKGQK